MKLKVNGIVPGQYTAEFDGTEPTESEQYGPGLVWKFVIVGGEFDGQIASRYTGQTPTAKNACGKLLKAISGKSLEVGAEIDPDDYAGKRFSILVAETQTGGCRVETAVRVKGGA